MQPLDQTSPAQPQYRSEDEIDLIDLIGFLWKIRRFIALGILLGVVTASGLALVGQKKAADPARQGMTFSIPLLEDASRAKPGPSLSAEERLKKINDMLTLPSTAKVFVAALLEAQVLTPPVTGQDAALSWFISQQKMDADKQTLAKLAVGPAGELQFTGTWPQSADLSLVAGAVVDGLNKMIAVFNLQAGQALDAKHQLGREKIAHMTKLRTEMSAMLFRLTELLGPVSPLSQALIAGEPTHPTVAGSDSEWSKVIRVLGLLASQGKITQAQNEAEGQKLAHLQEEYLALQPTLPVDTTAKKETPPPMGLLLQFTPHPAWLSADGKSQLVAEAAVDAGGVKSSFQKRPAVLIVLGLLLGGFVGTLSGGLWQFWRTNRSRLKEVLRA